MTPDDLDVQHHFVQLGELRMHYVARGKGPTVVLLHGFPECWWSWRHQLVALSDAGFRVIAPDLRGYGETDKQGPYDLDTLTRDVCMLIESLGAGPTAHVVGHDWGGAVAWHLGATRPERVEKLVILNCPHPAGITDIAFSSPRQLARSWYMFFFQIPALPEWLLTRNDAAEVVRQLRGVSVDRTNFSAEELRPIRDAIQKPGAAQAMVGWYRAAISDLLKRRGKAAPYETIRAETMLIWGLDDPALGFDDVIPPTRKYVADLRIEPVPHCGHFVHAEQPARVNQLLLDFIQPKKGRRAA